MKRRDLILGGLALGALGAAEALKPRRRLVLLNKGSTIDSAMPRDFGDWSSEATEGLVGPEQAGKLAKSLYSETVARAYYEESTAVTVMVLAAYGDTQSDLLQLHRPETCYPAVGFTITMSRPLDMPIGAAGPLPARRVIAEAEGRSENIVYWTRIGEALPRTGGEQRDARLRNAMEGFVGDGMLMRCSATGEPAVAFAALDRFVPALVRAIPKATRKAFIGTHLAQTVA